MNPAEYAKSIVMQFKELIASVDKTGGVLINDKALKRDQNIVINFIWPKTQADPIFQNRLFGLIELSKYLIPIADTAGCAITFLAGGGVKFINRDFTGVRIPGAYILNGIFVNASLKNADLTNVNFGKNCYFYSVDFSGAIVKGVVWNKFKPDKVSDYFPGEFEGTDAFFTDLKWNGDVGIMSIGNIDGKDAQDQAKYGENYIKFEGRLPTSRRKTFMHNATARKIVEFDFPRPEGTDKEVLAIIGFEANDQTSDNSTFATVDENRANEFELYRPKHLCSNTATIDYSDSDSHSKI
jgi:hypothetical protein